MGTFLDLYHQISAPEGTKALDWYGQELITYVIESDTVAGLWAKAEYDAMTTILMAAYDNEYDNNPEPLSDYEGTGDITHKLMHRLQNAFLPDGEMTHLVLSRYARLSPPHGVQVGVMTEKQRNEAYLYYTEELGGQLPESDKDILIALDLKNHPLLMPIASPVEKAGDKYTLRLGFACLGRSIVIGSF
jgi:hypothetical protein